MWKRKGWPRRRPPRSSPDFRGAIPAAAKAGRGTAGAGASVGGAAQLERRGGREKFSTLLRIEREGGADGVGRREELEGSSVENRRWKSSVIAGKFSTGEKNLAKKAETF